MKILKDYKVGDKVKHEQFGEGTVIRVSFEGTFRESYIVRFDNADEELHDGFGLTEPHHSWVCRARELETV